MDERESVEPQGITLGKRLGIVLVAIDCAGEKVDSLCFIGAGDGELAV
jgi:hypothetical protein